MHPVTREKLKFNEDMKQFVPAEQLWSTDWNGDMDFEYDHSTYWPALNALCQLRREQRMARWTAAGSQIGESEDYLAGGTDVSVNGFAFSSASASTSMSASAAPTVAVSVEGERYPGEVDAVQEKLAGATLENVQSKPAEVSPA